MKQTVMARECLSRPAPVWAMRLLAGMALTAGLSGCAVNPPAPEVPTLATITPESQALRQLPPPVRRLMVAVYDFPDLTGQFKERDSVQTLSRAVTQGGAPMLIKTLQEAGARRWFTVLDRARLDDLLKERQILTEMRRIYLGEQQVNAEALRPLAHADIIMQGGITGYDTNTKTGGLGAQHLGIGLNTRWQQDTVTVTLRAVSTHTGEVLASVSTHKMIASHALQGGLFRYIALDRLLEAEAGMTWNEPKQIAVQQAIEKAVMALALEGVELGLWAFADPALGAPLLQAYRDEKFGKMATTAGTAP